MYKAIVQFTDIKDHDHKYLPGDIYPRAGLEVSPERLEELASDKNRRRRPMIRLEVVKGEKQPENNKPVEDIKPEIEAPGVKEPVENFINPPEEREADEEPVKDEKPKRGRKKKD